MNKHTQIGALLVALTIHDNWTDRTGQTQIKAYIWAEGSLMA